MKVDFQRLTWEDYPSRETPINAENLNRLEEGVSGLYSDYTDMEKDLQALDGKVDGVYDFTHEKIVETVTDWLDENVDPAGSAVVVDESLTIEGAAADAKATGGVKTLAAGAYHCKDLNLQPIATFDDAADDVPLKDLKVAIEPVQDLHGYDHPWPAGGGKNIFNYDAWRPVVQHGTGVYENNGVTLTATSNDCYTDYKSTFSSDARIPITEGETITLCWEETTNTSGMIYIFPNGTESGLVSVNNANEKKLSYTAGSGVTYVTFRMGVGYSGNTVYYKNIQFVKGTTVPTSFSPYSNICPITGLTSLNVHRTGKNLIDFAGAFVGDGFLITKDTATNVITKNGVTFTVYKNTDGSIAKIVANGTATANAWIFSERIENKDFYLPDGEYIVSGSIGGSGTTWQFDVIVQDSNGNRTYNASKDGEYRFTMPQRGLNTITSWQIGVRSGVTVANQEFYPMVRKASEPAGYEPFKNRQKNLWSPDVANTYLRAATGLFETISGAASTDYIPAKPGEKYILLASGTSSGLVLGFFNSSKEYINGSAVAAAKHIVTAPANTAYVVASNAQSTTKTTQLLLSESYEIAFPAGTGTIYGGTVDPVNGFLVVDRLFIEFDGATTGKKVTGAGNDANNYNYFFTNSDISSYGYDNQWVPISELKGRSGCSHFEVGNNYSYDYAYGLFVKPSADNRADPRIVFPRSSGIDTVEKCNTYLAAQYSAGTPVQMWFELRIPQIYSLTPVQISTLLGINNVWSDKGTAISVAYRLDHSIYHDRIEDAELITESVSGSVASFSDGASDLPVKDLTVSLEPVQDLHGYEFPWPGGSRKNLVQMTDVGTTSANVTLTVNDDGTVNISGTSTATGNIRLCTSSNYDELKSILAAGGTFILSSNQPGLYNGNTFNVSIRYNFNSGASTAWIMLDAGAHTVPEGAVLSAVDLWYPANTAVKTVSHFALQLEKASAATSFEPYSNICPISGWTGVNVTRTGKNLFDYNTNMASGTSNQVTFTFNVDKTWTVNGTATNGAGDWVLWNITKDDLPSGTYIISREIASSNVQLYIDIRKNNTRVGQITNMLNIEEYEFAIDWDCGDYDLIRIGLYVNNGVSVSNVIVKPMLRLASILDSAYEPRVSNLFPITFPTSAGTVYGGELDVITGRLTLDRLCLTFDGSEDEEWGLSGGGHYRIFFGNGNFPKKNIPYTLKDSESARALCRCDRLRIRPSSETYAGDIGISLDSGGKQINLCWKDHTVVTVAEGRVWLAANPVQFVYPIDTPITYQCTPTEVRTLLAHNNIWADTGDITSVTYNASTKLYLDDKLANIQALILENISNS